MWEPFDGIRAVPGLSSSVFLNGRFRNPESWNEPRVPFSKFAKFLFSARPKAPPNFERDMVHSTSALAEKDAKSLVRRSVWLGHACFFVELENGIRFVTGGG